MVPRRVPSAALATILTYEFGAGMYDIEEELEKDDAPVLVVDALLTAPTLLIFTRLKPQLEP